MLPIMNVKLGLYRHFKGGYYLLLNLLRTDKVEEPYYAQYLDIMHIELGYFTRPFSEWSTDVLSREDNVTGQRFRFEKVNSLLDNAQNMSTEHLIRELRCRADSPLQELDIDGLSALVYSSDYCIGEAFEATDDNPKGVSTDAVFDTPEQAFKYLREHPHSRRHKVFKRTFIEQKDTVL